MSGHHGAFQIVGVYYSLLIRSRPVIAWNMVAVLINFGGVAAYVRLARLERDRRQT